MGLSYPITLAIIIAGCIMITLFIIYSGILPYVNLITSSNSFIVTFYYLSTNFFTITIKNTGRIAIRRVYIYIKNLADYSTVVEGVCYLNLPSKDSKTIYYNFVSHSHTSSCTFKIYGEIERGNSYIIIVEAEFINGYRRVASLRITVIS